MPQLISLLVNLLFNIIDYSTIVFLGCNDRQSSALDCYERTLSKIPRSDIRGIGDIVKCP